MIDSSIELGVVHSMYICYNGEKALSKTQNWAIYMCFKF